MSILSPARRVLFEATPMLFAFGNTPAHNALEGFHPDFAESGLLKVLFLGCGDLRNPLTTASRSGHSGNLQIHVNDSSLPVIGRNVLILKIISSPNFNPDDEEDMAYVWDLWYNATWSQSTLDRFLQDVQSLLNEILPDSIVIPKRSYLEDLKELWTFWLSATKSVTCDQILEARRTLAIEGYTKKGLLRHGTFSETVDVAVKRVEHYLTFAMNVTRQFTMESYQELLGKVRDEIRHYFETGISCAAGRMASSSVNPTMLQPVTGKWIVHYAACPLEGYLPTADFQKLENSSSKNGGIVFSYCRNELENLLMAFRKRMEQVKFFFHPCDALALCYEESLEEFDVIDTSNLADHVGLANLLNGTARKLRSDQSILLTESIIWYKVAPDVAHFIQEVLCCPLSLIPTLYGLRLINNIELGAEYATSFDLSPPGYTSRLHWKKSLPLDGVPLTMSPTLEESLKRLKMTCFLQRTTPSGMASLMSTPLTFHYVLSDLVHRGRIHQSFLDSASSLFHPLPPVFRKGVEAIQAWMMMEQSPGDVWQVEVCTSFEPIEQFLYDSTWPSRGHPILRLVLIPTSSLSDYLAVAFKTSTGADKFFDPDSTDNHFLDHFVFKEKLKPDGGIEEVNVTFLLKDRGLIESHSGIIIDYGTSLPVFIIGPFLERQYRVELLDRPYYPWAWRREEPAASSRTRWLVGQSCQESEGDYSIRLRVKGSFPSGLKVTTDYDEVKMWPCLSAHRITVSLDGVDPLTITLPHPILPSTIKVTLRRKGGIVEIMASKALRELWPEDVLHQGSPWNVEAFKSSTAEWAFHVGLQFSTDYLNNPYGAGMEVTSPLTQVREIIRNLFVRTMKLNDQFYSVRLNGSSESSPDCWYIRTHPPIRISPQGTPILVVSALDHRLAKRLKSQGKFDAEKDFSRIFPASSEKIVPIWAYTPEEVGLFRSILRINSTKIRPTEWQSENLPNGERGRPWLATFVRPLYRDGHSNDDNQELLLPRRSTSRISNTCSAPAVVIAVDDRTCCATCMKAAIPLKRCGRCKAVAYCSVECQRADWKKHKPSCF